MHRTAFFRNKFLVLMVLLASACSAGKDPAGQDPSPAPSQREGRPLPQSLSKGEGSSIQLPYYNTPDFSPHFLSRPDSVRAQITHRIGSFSFEDQDGRRISNGTVQGKIHVANFMFTSCGSICPVMTGELKKVAEAFRAAPDVVLLSYSVTPWIDTKAQLQRYRKARGLEEYTRWHFLTGKKETIYSLARRSYFAEEEIGFTRDSTEFLHTEHLVLVDGEGRIRGIYNGTLALETEQLIKDVAALLREKNKGNAAQETAAKHI